MGTASTAASALGTLLLCTACTGARRAEVAAAAGMQEPQDAPRRAAIERGRYLAHDVAMCVQCHTPHRADGSLETTRLFEGQPFPLASPFAETPWAARTPHIRGLPGYTVEEGVRLLAEGLHRDGSVPEPPMPPFRMTREDAEAVVLYLKSLD